MIVGSHVRKSVDPLVIVTLGPSSLKPDILHRLSRRSVSYVRINLSHTARHLIPETIDFVREHCAIPLMLDTEGSQVRTGVLEAPLELGHNRPVWVVRDGEASSGQLPLRPNGVFSQLTEGDLLAVDFDSAVIRVDDTSEAHQGRLQCTVLSGGTVQSNKAVTVPERTIVLPPLSEKDVFAVEYGANNGIDSYCLSFVDHPDDVLALRKIHPNAFVLAKIETKNGIHHLDGIMAEADGILIDRGDLSREVPIERLPFAQKHIIARANKANVPVVVATNLLDTMIRRRAPSRAETNDVVNTLLDGADGLVLAAETAIGLHPVETVSFLVSLCHEVRQTQRELLSSTAEGDVLQRIHQANYITSPTVGYSLVPPHGGLLVDQRWEGPLPKEMNTLALSEEEAMDVELIALGAYSPLRGFMDEDTLESVVHEMRLPNGHIWPLPILLRRSEPLARGSRWMLTYRGAPIGMLEVSSCFERDWGSVAEAIFGIRAPNHPGVERFMNGGPVAIAGTTWLFERVPRPTKRYELAPAQCRRLLEANRWSVVVGLHTRNGPSRAHEFIMMEALRRVHGDGVLIHPAVGSTRAGRSTPEAFIAGFDEFVSESKLADRAVFAAFPAHARQAGPREALFSALCRQNYGCSHLVLERADTSASTPTSRNAPQSIFDRFPDLVIESMYVEDILHRSAKRYEEVQVGHLMDDTLP